MQPVQKTLPDSVLKESKKIIRTFPLCDSCLGRLYARKLRLVSSKSTGSRIKSQINHKKSEKCYICKDLLSNLDSYVDQLASISEKTHYSSFLIGAILRPSLVDRDDLVRSRFQMRGTDGIKTEITKSLTKSFARKSKKPADHLDPELTLLVNFRTGICEQRAKSVVVSGRYTKNRRGLPQKQQPCRDCRGKGCIFCSNHGITDFNSVEGIISKLFYEKFDSPQARFTWIGGEDRDSLVKGKGRLFFAKMANPKLRNSKLEKAIDLGDVSLSELRRIEQIPSNPIKFQSRVALHIQSNAKITSKRLSRMSALTRDPIMISDGNRSLERSVRELAYKKTSPDTFSVTLLADGGLSMKKLVEGGGASPNISEILGTDCTCVRFDFEDIAVNDNK